VGFNLLSKIGAVLAVVGILGYAIIFPSVIAKDGQDFEDQFSVDANGVETFGDYNSGDLVTIVDKISRMQYDNDKTSVWVESIGKSDTDLRFIFNKNLMSDFGVGSNIVITFEVGNSGQSESVINEDISTRPSTMYDYIFIILTAAGFGLVVFGFVRSAKQRLSPVATQDDWGSPAPPAMAPAPVAPPAVPPQPQYPPSMAAIPQTGYASSDSSQMNSDVTGMSFSAVQPASMTITVPPGVVPGQVLTVTMPSGQVVNVQVPPGCAPGSQFTISVTQ
jgi:hypothetical protein